MVRVIMIVEMAGKPANLVKEKLTEHVKILEKIKDLKVHSIKVSEPKLIPNSPEVYTCFAEADFEAPTFIRITEIMFDFLPSSIEVIEPGKITMDLHDATTMLNRLSGRLHRYDEIVKVTKSKANQIFLKLQETHKKLLEKENETKNPKKDSKGKKTAKKKSKKKVPKAKAKGKKKS